MEGIERLYYGLGLLAYAVAKADGKINNEERNKLHEIVIKDAKCSHYEIDISEIIFHVLSKHDSFSQDMLYNLAIKEIKACKHLLEEDMRSDFPAILEKVARSFHPITSEENEIIQRFRQDLEKL